MGMVQDLSYYTLDLQHNFVLAHYNWHQFADLSLSKGIIEPKVNLGNINIILNRRINRMFDICNSAKYILFVFGEYQQYNCMAIDEHSLYLHDLQEIKAAVQTTFSAKSFVTLFSEVNSADKVLEMIK